MNAQALGQDMNVKEVVGAWAVQAGKLRTQAAQLGAGSLADGPATTQERAGARQDALDVAATLAKAAGVRAKTPEQAVQELLRLHLGEQLPRLLKEAEEAAATLRELFRGGMTLGEVRAVLREARDVGDLLALASADVVARLPYLKDLDALALAQVLTRALLRHAVQPVVPALLYPMLERAVVAGVEWLYKSRVNPPQL